MHKLDCFGRKHGLSGTGNAQPFRDICLGLFGGERLGFAPDGNTLAQLAHTGMAKLVGQLRLPGKDDLEQLFRRRF
jgi:hypothetical protein